MQILFFCFHVAVAMPILWCCIKHERKLRENFSLDIFLKHAWHEDEARALASFNGQQQLLE